jgi:hypothetical protein
MLDFEPVAIGNQADYRKVLAKTPVVASDYSFINIWGWAEEYGLQWAWEDPIVWIRQTYPSMALWAPVGPWPSVDWQRRIERISQNSTVFIRVPEPLLKLWEGSLKSRIGIEETRSQWDYLYNASNLVQLKGKLYHKKKNLLNQFKKKYSFQYIPLGRDMVVKIMAMQSDWCEWRDCEMYDSLAAENRVIEKVLKQWENLDQLFGGALCVEDKIVAYTLAERLDDAMVLIHFEKGSPGFIGGYQAINQMFLERLAEKERLDACVVNRMQDLGDEGLRKAKKSYHPVDFIRKSKVTIHR